MPKVAVSGLRERRLLDHGKHCFAVWREPPLAIAALETAFLSVEDELALSGR